jgi:hypothetical protein
MRRSIFLFVVLALLVAACGGSTDDTATTTTTVGVTSDNSDATDTTASTSAPDTTLGTASDSTTTSAATTTGNTDGAGPLAAALAQTGEATSARMEGSITMKGLPDLPAGTDVSMSFRGAFDLANESSSFVVDLSEMASGLPGSDEIPAEFADLFGEMEIRTIGDTAYMKFGLFSMLGITTEWVSMPAEDAGTTASSFGASSADPLDLLAAFGSVEADVEEIGNEQVRGNNTTHFRLLVDVAAMAEAADPDALSELDNLGGFPEGGAFPVDFWIGDDGHIYRFSFTMDGSVDPTAEFESMVMLWEVFDYGAAVSITAPPAEDVTDGSNLGGLVTG